MLMGRLNDDKTSEFENLFYIPALKQPCYLFRQPPTNSIMIIAIVGGGNSAHILLNLYTRQNIECILITRRPTEWNTNGITMQYGTDSQRYLQRKEIHSVIRLQTHPFCRRNISVLSYPYSNHIITKHKTIHKTHSISRNCVWSISL